MEPEYTPAESDLVAEARAEGITDPVIFYLDEECSQARAIYQELHGNPMQPRSIGLDTVGAIEKLSRPEAIRLLRQHGSKVGIYLAAMLQRPIPSQYSRVCLWEPNSMVEIVTEARYLSTLTLGYEEIMLRLHQSETPASYGSSTFWLLEFDDGQFVPLCSTANVYLIGLLTVLAATRKKWVERKGRMLQIEAYDSDLAAELLEYKDRPEVVAEAIRALRKLGHDKDRWLTSVLWDRRPLRALARRVEHELTGR
jgi:hypothetical protein